MRPRRVEPGPGQESVWDYPRPPAVEPCDHHVTVTFAGTVIAESRRPVRVLETSQPPAYYLPAAKLIARIGYQRALVTGLGIMAAGTLGMVWASHAVSYAITNSAVSVIA